MADPVRFVGGLVIAGDADGARGIAKVYLKVQSLRHSTDVMVGLKEMIEKGK